ncbi:VOC family protein [Roseovarius aestuarii]|uniref:Glyoxalase-like domain protein n=1 Tax=Roseovarius aestuarii TaxID=475083 RepID=A0A1X7BYB9_9RHOB|nr:VOC family protein [Roseovarius aestuarii]SMC14657.1 Glyoxalase-like domain protein [Roseovarius aestuarii]
MPLIDHLSVGVADIDRARVFYDSVLAALGTGCLAADDEFAAYGQIRPEFLLLLPYDGGAPTGGNGTHIAFSAESKDAVDSFHAAALENGGTCEGAPGGRDFYPMPDAYTAYVRDSFGNKLEVIFNGFSTQEAPEGNT